MHDVAVLLSGHIYCMDPRMFVGYLLLIMTKSDSQTGFRRTVGENDNGSIILGSR